MEEERGNRAAQWPVSAAQLTAPLGCREATWATSSLCLTEQETTEAAGLQNFFVGFGQFAAQLDALGKTALDVQASASSTEEIISCRGRSVQTVSAGIFIPLQSNSDESQVSIHRNKNVLKQRNVSLLTRLTR